MYKVYQDPEGKQCMEQNSTVITNNAAISSETNEAYKRTIEGLNREIKSLHNELKKVRAEIKFFALFYSLNLSTIICDPA